MEEYLHTLALVSTVTVATGWHGRMVLMNTETNGEWEGVIFSSVSIRIALCPKPHTSVLYL